MADPVRLALIGCGRIAQVAHLPAVEKAEGVELVAVCDPSDGGGRLGRAPLRRRRRLHRPAVGLGRRVGRGGDRHRTRPVPPRAGVGGARRRQARAGREAPDRDRARGRGPGRAGGPDRADAPGGGDEAPRRGGPVRPPVHRRAARPGPVVQRLVPHRRPAPGHRGDPVPAGRRRARRPPAGGGVQGRPPAVPARHPRGPCVRHRPVPARRGRVGGRPAPPGRPRPCLAGAADHHLGRRRHGHHRRRRPRPPQRGHRGVRRRRGGPGRAPLPVLPPGRDRARLRATAPWSARPSPTATPTERQVEAFARAIRAGGRSGTRTCATGWPAIRLIEATATAVERGSEVRL